MSTAVMSKYHKMDTKGISEYIWMPHYVQNEFLNIFECNILTERISEYICILEISRIRIQIIFEGRFTQIFKYLYSSLIKETLKKGSLMLPVYKIVHWIFLMHKLYLNIHFFISQSRLFYRGLRPS